MTRPTLHALTVAAATLMLASWLGACTEVTQSQDDCTENQFFDFNASLCRTCPPLELPGCPSGCGVALELDDRGCQEAVCDCSQCPDGQFFDDQLIECVQCPAASPTCGAGCQAVGVGRDERGCQAVTCACDPVCNPRVLAETGQCQACPEGPAQSCGDAGCCQLDNATDDDGCPMLECTCPEEAPEGFFYDDADVCRACPSDGGPEECAP